VIADTLLFVLAASGMANAVMVALLVIGAVLYWRKRRQLADQALVTEAVRAELDDEMADNDRLQVENDRLVAENTVIRRENDELRDDLSTQLANAVEMDS
jgi:cell division protein FtsB